ncbi:hypothetical protein B4U80_11098, partial [Leptotrombidium deliense]
MKEFAKENNGFTFLLTVVDVLSRFAWTIPLKNKSGETLTKAMKHLFKSRKPVYLQTDKGKEFYNANVQKLFKDLGIHHFSTENSDIKCAIVERFNRTLKGRMFRYFTHTNSRRYIDVVNDLVNGYNDTVHRSIKMKPAAVKKYHEKDLFRRLYGYNTKLEMVCEKLRKKHKVKSSEWVRIPYDNSNRFARGYYPQWKEEVFQVSKPIKKQEQ